jgi:hypothetical protein
MTVRWFGRKYDAPIYDSCPRVDAPLGRECLHCNEEIALGDDGFYDAGDSVFHRACFLRMIVGSVFHQQMKCSCFGGSDQDRLTAGLTVRQEAEEALAHHEGHQHVN